VPDAATAGEAHPRALSSMELYQPMRLWLVPQSDRSDGHILGMMAVSLTYFSTSAKRIVDAVPMHIMHYMVARCAPACYSYYYYCAAPLPAAAWPAMPCPCAS
jgi:hypothetical protein